MYEHLSDAMIYEFLDDILQPQERASAAAHLESCEACASRMSQSQALFQALDELPEVELQRELVSGVLDAIGDSSAALESEDRTETLPWVFLGQLLVALILIILIWPMVAIKLPLDLADGYYEQASLAISSTLLDWIGKLEWLNLSIQDGVAGLSETWMQLIHSSLWAQVSILEVALLLASVTILWLAGNTLLLRSHAGRRSHFERRNPSWK